jgi:tetratricopeptide (TPR) repeat protein
MARAYVQAKDFDQAVAAFEEAVAQKPADPDVFFDAGLAYKSMRDYGRAAEMFRSVTRMKPSNRAAYTQLAAVSALHFLDRGSSEGNDD